MSDEPVGSVAIADVQLERVPGPGSAPTGYVSNELSLEHVTNNCPYLNAAEFRDAFTRECSADDPTRCYYELNSPLIIDTSQQYGAGSALNGRIARDNFNLRHITVALNLVGTGLRDCSDSIGLGCYGSGYTEYSLHHDAFQSSVLGWNGETQMFSFGSAGINFGKALTSERYITFPIGSADSAMLSQPGIEKIEFSGRPLDGSYRLRIYDDGTLQWDQLKDIQLVLKYRYWSLVQR
jgi:hypothetical protein